MKENKILRGERGNAFSYFKNNNHKLLKSKKAETIGTTWDMIFGFFIIMFLLTIFLTVSFFIAEKKAWFGGGDVNLNNYEDDSRSQTILFSLMDDVIIFDGKEGKIKDILRDIELYNLNSDKRTELKDLLRNETFRLIGNNSNRCYIFQAIYGINDTKKMSDVDPRGGQYVADFIEKNTLEFSSANYDVDIRGLAYVQKQVDKMLAKSESITLIRNTTINLFGVDTGEKQKIYIKFYNGECLG